METKSFGTKSTNCYSEAAAALPLGRVKENPEKRDIEIRAMTAGCGMQIRQKQKKMQNHTTITAHRYSLS